MKVWQHLLATWPVESRSEEAFKKFIFHEVCFNICIIHGTKFDKNEPSSKGFIRQVVEVLKTGISVYSNDIIEYLKREIDSAPFAMSQRQSLIDSITLRSDKSMFKAFKKLVDFETQS